jgi:hypothetical protein
MASASFFAGALAVACSLTTSFEGFTGGNGIDASASPHDSSSPLPGPSGDGGAASADPGVDASAPGGANLAPNGGFEDDANSCAGWRGFNASVATDPIAHSGARSCRVCQSGAGGIAIDHDPDLDPNARAGAHYHGRAFLRAAPGSTAPLLAVIAIRIFDGAGNEAERSTSDKITLSQTWQPIDVTHTTAIDPGRVNLFGYPEAPENGFCFLIDDILFEKLP